MALTMSQTARFGVFELNPQRRELHRKGVRIKLQQQQFEILCLLVQRKGEMVTRDEIQKALWPEAHFVDFERSINTAVMRLRHALRDNAGSPTYIETVARTGYRLIPPVVTDATSTLKGEIRAIAVLPLQDLSTTESDYFVEGLTDALVTALAVESNFRLVSRSSMLRYKNSKLTIRQIATELGVQAVVEGSCLRAGDRIRISVRLLDAAQDTHLWAQTYDRDLKDILLLQEEIARSIAASATAAIKKSPTKETPRQINPRAYELYLRGNFMLSSRVSAQMAKAVECYENAIYLEPQWAPPHAMLADSCRMQEFYNYPASKALLSRAQSLAEKALLLDPGNAQANAIAGVLLAIHEWDWGAGLEKVQAALRLDPRSAHIEHICSQIMLHMGRFDEALRHADNALSIDPSSLLLWSYRAQILLFARRPADCLHETERLLEQNPTFAISVISHAGALLELGRAQQALGYFEQLITATNWPMAMAGRMHALRRLGLAQEAKSDLTELERLHEEGVCPSSIMAWGYAMAGEVEAVFRHLKIAVGENDSRLAMFLHLSHFDPFRDDERFIRILEPMHLKKNEVRLSVREGGQAVGSSGAYRKVSAAR